MFHFIFNMTWTLFYPYLNLEESESSLSHPTSNPSADPCVPPKPLRPHKSKVFLMVLGATEGSEQRSNLPDLGAHGRPLLPVGAQCGETSAESPC